MPRGCTRGLAKTVLQATALELSKRRVRTILFHQIRLKPSYVYFLAFVMKTFAGCTPRFYWRFCDILKPVLATLSDVLN